MNTLFPRLSWLCLTLILALMPWTSPRADERASGAALTLHEVNVCLGDPQCISLLAKLVWQSELLPPNTSLDNEPHGPPNILPDIGLLFERLRRLKKVCLCIFSCDCGVTLKRIWEEVFDKWLEQLGIRERPGVGDLLKPDPEEIDAFLENLRRALQSKKNSDLISLLEMLKLVNPDLAAIIDRLIETLRGLGEASPIDPVHIEQLIEELRRLIIPPQAVQQG